MTEQIESSTGLWSVYELPESLFEKGEWGASCLSNISDGFTSKEKAMIWCLEMLTKNLEIHLLDNSILGD